MTISEAILYPGTRVCQHFGIKPEGEGALIRWMVNTLVYLCVSLIIVWIVVT